MFLFFFFNDTATTEIYTLSLHDALPIWLSSDLRSGQARRGPSVILGRAVQKWYHIRCSQPMRIPVIKGTIKRRLLINFRAEDRKSTRLNSSHQIISYAVFCLKKKKQ